MKQWIATALVAVIAASFSFDALAQKRLGGGKNLGAQSPTMQQRQALPPQKATPPAQQAAPTQPAQQPAAAPAAAGAAGAAKAASPWRGALMGLAAGLGIAALASWLGFGEALATFLTVALLALVAVVVIGFVLRKLRGPQSPQPAYAGGPARDEPVGYEAQPSPQPAPLQRSALDQTIGGPVRPGSVMDEFLRGGAVTPAEPRIPAGFDVDGFLAHAKTAFGRLQAAWDRGDYNEIGDFTTDEMFTALTHELRAQPRRNLGTRVDELKAELLGIDTLPHAHLASVRFTGAMTIEGAAERFDEVWMLSKAADGKSGWLLAGIQQLDTEALDRTMA